MSKSSRSVFNLKPKSLAIVEVLILVELLKTLAALCVGAAKPIVELERLHLLITSLII